MKRIMSFVVFMGISLTTPNKGLSDLLENEATLEDYVEAENFELKSEVVEEPVVAPEDMIVRDFHRLHPAFRNKIIQLVIDAKKHDIDIVVSETYRTPERQNKYLKRGLTKLKGGKSKHQFGLAIDIIPVVNGVSQHNNHDVLKKVGVLGEKLGLRWGGRWKRLYNPVHFEWECKISDLENGWEPEIPDTVMIPAENFFYAPIKK